MIRIQTGAYQRVRNASLADKLFEPANHSLGLALKGLISYHLSYSFCENCFHKVATTTLN